MAPPDTPNQLPLEPQESGRVRLSDGSQLPQNSYVAGQIPGFNLVAIPTDSFDPTGITTTTPEGSSVTRKPRVNHRDYNHLLKGTAANNFAWELPDLPDGMKYNWTAAEIIAYMPKLVRVPEVARRLQFNGIDNRIHQRMIAEFRSGIGPVDDEYGKIQQSEAQKLYPSNTIRRQYEAAMRQICPPVDDTKWNNTNTALFKPDEWDQLHGSDISMNCYMTRCQANGKKQGAKSVELLALLDDVANPPTGNDTADLTRVFEYAKANPRPGNPYKFPNSLPAIMAVIGMSTITPEQYDSSIFARHPAAERERPFASVNRTRNAQGQYMSDAPANDAKDWEATEYMEEILDNMPPNDFPSELQEEWATLVNPPPSDWYNNELAPPHPGGYYSNELPPPPPSNSYNNGLAPLQEGAGMSWLPQPENPMAQQYIFPQTVRPQDTLLDTSAEDSVMSNIDPRLANGPFSVSNVNDQQGNQNMGDGSGFF